MAKGDVRTHAARGGRGYSGGGSSYDDEGRGESKSIWEWFEANYTAHDFAKSWLIGLSDNECYRLLKNSVSRYGLVDIAYFWTPGWNVNQDTRAHKLVTRHLSESDWLDFHSHLVDGYNRTKARLDEEYRERAKKRDEEYAAYQATRDAAQAIIEREDYEKIQQTVAPTVGMFQSEFDTAFRYHDQVGDSGDWIDSTVDAYVDGSGYGFENQKATGVKLQITVALDLSNSMYYNGVHIIAAEAFRNLCLTLEELKGLYQDDMFTSYWTFSLDGYNDHGKEVTQLVFRGEAKNEYDLKALREYAPSKIGGWYGTGPFRGEDTWISPLFQSIERWEKENSDSGAKRLDIIITDAVLEHPADIRDADKIQERRDGTLSSVLLNFMPVEDWLGSTLPRRCYQMAVDKDNVAGILRQVLSEFVGVSV